MIPPGIVNFFCQFLGNGEEEHNIEVDWTISKMFTHDLKTNS